MPIIDLHEPDEDAEYAAIREQLDPLFQRVHQASRDHPFPNAEVRLDRLQRLAEMTEAAESRIVAAIDADFGGRAKVETLLAETSYVIAAVAHARRQLRGWMKTRTMPTALHFRPLSNSVLPQPLGTVGVIAPSNYPYHLAIAPLVGIFAAGNRAMVKLPEETPNTADLICELVSETFNSSELLALSGGCTVGRAFASLPFDHLMFTGSSRTGAEVAATCARNHVPVTLELGGKSPVILDPSARLPQAVRQIAWAKCFNAGQTCLAPDYALVPYGMREAFVAALADRMARMYPAERMARDYTAILTDGRRARLERLLAEAEDHGATVIRPLGTEAPGRRMPPAIVVEPPEHLPIMQEEIFGPILPVLACSDTENALAMVGRLPRPLAVYWFGRDRAAEAMVARESWSGGLSVNTCMLQIAQEELPFGGVGASGVGHYHGRWGFEEFSKLKPVTRRPGRFDPSRLFQPPYGPGTRSAIDLFRRAVRLRGQGVSGLAERLRLTGDLARRALKKDD